MWGSLVLGGDLRGHLDQPLLSAGTSSTFLARQPPRPTKRGAPAAQVEPPSASRWLPPTGSSPALRNHSGDVSAAPTCNLQIRKGKEDQGQRGSAEGKVGLELHSPPHFLFLLFSKGGKRQGHLIPPTQLPRLVSWSRREGREEEGEFLRPGTSPDPAIAALRQD